MSDPPFLFVKHGIIYAVISDCYPKLDVFALQYFMKTIYI